MHIASVTTCRFVVILIRSAGGIIVDKQRHVYKIVYLIQKGEGVNKLKELFSVVEELLIA